MKKNLLKICKIISGIFKQFTFHFFSLFAFSILIWSLVNLFGLFTIQDNDREAIITALVTISIFGLGLITSSISDKVKLIKKDNLLKKVILYNLRTIIDGLIFQIDDGKRAIEILKSKTPEDITISSFAELDHIEINNTPSETLFRIFINNFYGKEEIKVNTLENLRKQLRFIASSKEYFITGVEKYVELFRGNSDEIINDMKELGNIYDIEATKLLSSNLSIEQDRWFENYGNSLEEARRVFRNSEDTYTDFELFEKKIIPAFQDFLRNNIEDPRNSKVSIIFTHTMTATFLRKDMIRNLINFIENYISKYELAKNVIENALLIYAK